MTIPRVATSFVVLSAAIAGLGFAAPPQKPAGPSFGTPQAARPKAAADLVKTRLALDTLKIEPGQMFHVAVIFAIEPEWHVYWKNAGTSGSPTDITVQAPAGFKVGPTLFTRPTSFTGEDGVSYGYRDEAVLFVPVTAPAVLPANASLDVSTDFLVCKDICLMGSATNAIALPLATSLPSTQQPAPASLDPIVARYQAHLPGDWADVTDGVLKHDGRTLTIELPARGYTTAEFFPIEHPGVTYGEATVTIKQDRAVITMPITLQANNAMGKPMRIAGLVGLGNEGSDPSYEFEIPVDTPNQPPVRDPHLPMPR